MAKFRSALLAFLIVLLNCTLAAPVSAESITLSTSEREFSVTSYQLPGTSPRSAVVVLGGARGYESDAYRLLGEALNSKGIDMFLVHFVSSADVTAMESAGSSGGRIAYYGTRMKEWRETVKMTVSEIAGHSRYRQGKIGVLGVSLGAMPVLAETANSSTIAASVAVDGGFPATFKTAIRSMPPFLAVWGSNDRVFSVATGRAIHEKARSLGGPSEIVVYRGQGHGFFLEKGNVNAEKARHTIATFFARYLKS